MVEIPVGSVTGTVLDKDLLVQGGDIALVPFKAGPQAEATDELDRLSLMIIKGIKESLDDLQLQFKQLFDKELKFLKEKQSEVVIKIQTFINDAKAWRRPGRNSRASKPRWKRRSRSLSKPKYRAAIRRSSR